MKKRIWILLLALCVCAAVIWTQHPAAQAAITTDDCGNICFATIADLEKLCAKTYTEQTFVYYSGSSDTFTISRDLTFPENLVLDFSYTGTNVVIKSGVTVNATNSGTCLITSGLTVNGTLNIGRELQVYGDLTVNGKLHFSGFLMMWGGYKLTGYENITRTNSWDTFRITYNVYNKEDLMAALKEAGADTRQIVYDILAIIPKGSTITTTSSVTIPGNTKFSVFGGMDEGGTFTVGGGTTMTVIGSANFQMNTKINGSLVNNGTVYFYPYNGSKLAFASASGYSGKGSLFVSKGIVSSYTDAISGLNWNALTVEEDDWNWTIRPVDGLIPPSVTLSNVASTGKIKISWEAVPGAAKYEIYRRYGDESWVKLATTTETSAVNNKTDAGVTYYYKVRAVSEDGSEKSEFSAVMSRMCDLPRPVVTLSNVASSGKIKLQWDAIEGATGYAIYRSTDNKTWTQLSTVTGTSVTNTKAEAGITYYYKVRAIASNASANSAYSAVKSRMCDLPQPVITLSNVASTGKIKISWNAISGAQSYAIYRSTDQETWTKLATVTGTSATNTKADVGVTYYYKVRAIAENSSANSAYSAVKSRMCDLPRPVLSVTLNSSGNPKLSWDAIDGAVNYAIYRSTDKETWTKLSTVTGTSVTNTKVEAGVTYYYKIRAIASNTSANSAYSAVKSATAK